MGGDHQGDLLPLRIIALGSLEVRADRRRAAERLPGGLGDQLADDRCPFASDVPEPVPLARLVLTRVADRPDRFEPRMTKRKPKNYDRLPRPRQEIKREMIKRFSKI
jgi:hypothetical protein